MASRWAALALPALLACSVPLLSTTASAQSLREGVNALDLGPAWYWRATEASASVPLIDTEEHWAYWAASKQDPDNKDLLIKACAGVDGTTCTPGQTEYSTVLGTQGAVSSQPVWDPLNPGHLLLWLSNAVLVSAATNTGNRLWSTSPFCGSNTKDGLNGFFINPPAVHAPSQLAFATIVCGNTLTMYAINISTSATDTQRSTAVWSQAIAECYDGVACLQGPNPMGPVVVDDGGTPVVAVAINNGPGVVPAGGASGMHAYNALTGVLEWTDGGRDYYAVSAPTVTPTGGVCYTGAWGTGGLIHCLHADGTVDWRSSLPSGNSFYNGKTFNKTVAAQPVIATVTPGGTTKHILLQLDGSGCLSGFDLSDGTLLWGRNLGGTFWLAENTAYLAPPIVRVNLSSSTGAAADVFAAGMVSPTQDFIGDPYVFKFIFSDISKLENRVTGQGAAAGYNLDNFVDLVSTNGISGSALDSDMLVMISSGGAEGFSEPDGFGYGTRVGKAINSTLQECVSREEGKMITTCYECLSVDSCVWCDGRCAPKGDQGSDDAAFWVYCPENRDTTVDQDYCTDKPPDKAGRKIAIALSVIFGTLGIAALVRCYTSRRSNGAPVYKPPATGPSYVPVNPQQYESQLPPPAATYNGGMAAPPTYGSTVSMSPTPQYQGYAPPTQTPDKTGAGTF